MSARARLTRLAQNLNRNRKPKPQLIEAAKKTSWNIVRGDKVQVIEKNHPECGKQGTVLKVFRKRDRVLVEGVNMGNRYIKGDKDRGIQGKIISQERSIHYSNVSLVDPVHGIPTQIYKKVLEDGSKVRVSKKSGAIIPRPEILKFRKRPVNSIVTESDTGDEEAWEITYDYYEEMHGNMK